MLTPINLIIIYLIAINIVTNLIYYEDKRSAINGEWRIAEGSLFFFALIGGSPAALFATHFYRHKIRKNSFMDILYLIIALQIIVIGVVLGFVA